MLEKFLTDPAAVECRRAGLFGPHLDSFVATVSELGYARSTVRAQLWLLDHLERWLKRKSLAVVDLEEQVVNQFLAKRRRKGRRSRGERRMVGDFLEHLREKGVIPLPAPTIDESPLATLYKRYEDYLRKERGLCAGSVTAYWPIVRHFIVERFRQGPICLAQLIPDDISPFLLRNARSGSPKSARLMVTALRSFFRFLFRHGETKTDLAGAVPAVAAWRLAEVPKYLEAEDVERIPHACDRSTSVGRRNYAVILLLVRLGLRGGEIVALKLDDIDWRAGVLTVHGKGCHHDRLPLPADVGEAVAAYLRQDRPRCATRRVFIRNRAPHRGFTGPSCISMIVRRALKRAGLQTEFKGAHLLRHSLATRMLRRGASMAEIGEILRHRLPDTTEIYAKVDTKGLRSLALPWPTKGGEQ